MPRRPRREDAESLRQQLEALVHDFEDELQSSSLRTRVLALIPVFHKLRDLGSSLLALESEGREAARTRILHYFLKYPHEVLGGDELLVISGIQEYARRVRELRVQLGWKIISGVTAREMIEQGEIDSEFDGLDCMTASDYALLDTEPDREGAHRWNVANEIRKQTGSVRDKLLEYLRRNVNRAVTGDELRYVANDKKEWARRVRELRTEMGWPIATKAHGRPDLPVGVYLLEADRQTPPHDRNITDTIRGEVLRQDHYRCQECGWEHGIWNRSDPRHLELHHIMPHAEGGQNDKGNLLTLCTVCHDAVHAAL